jgi:hypothetical protein
LCCYAEAAVNMVGKGLSVVGLYKLNAVDPVA